MDPKQLQYRFALTLRRLRLAAGLGQEPLADRAGIHRTHVSLLERGQRMPTLLVVAKLAAALGMTMWQLLREVESAAPVVDPPAIPRGRPRRPVDEPLPEQGAPRRRPRLR